MPSNDLRCTDVLDMSNDITPVRNDHFSNAVGNFKLINMGIEVDSLVNTRPLPVFFLPGLWWTNWEQDESSVWICYVHGRIFE